MNEEKKSLARYDKELANLEKSLKSKKQGFEDSKLEMQQLSIDLSNMNSELDSVSKNLEALENKNTWIRDQAKLFGVQGGVYDFSKVDIPDVTKRVKVLKTRHETLGRSVDTTALEMFERFLVHLCINFSRVEKKETALKQKLSVVQKDKTSITSTLEYLDRKKLDQLNKTWRKVNGYHFFANIFFNSLVISVPFLAICFQVTLVN